MVRNKVTEFFVELNDFYIEFDQIIKSSRIEEGFSKYRNRASVFSESEMMSILLLFHFGHFTNFKHFYIRYVQKHLTEREFWIKVSFECFAKLTRLKPISIK